MSKGEDIKFLRTQTCILKVNIDCDGCKQKVKKLLHKIEGVYTTTIDAEHGKVTVFGDVDSATLIKKLAKAGKHAELLFPKGGAGGNKLQLDNGGKGGQKDAGKPQKGGGGGNNQKGQQPNPLNMFKGLNFSQLKDPKDQKSVKFMLPEDDEGSDFDDEFDDEDEFDDDYDDLDGLEDDFEEVLKGVKPKPMGGGVVNEKKGGGGGGGGGGNNSNNSAKKGGGGAGDVNEQAKGADAKNGNSSGKKGGGGGGGGGGKNAGGGGGSHDSKSGGNNKAPANGNKNNNGNAGGGKQGGGKGDAGGGGGGGQLMNHQALMAQMANMNMPTGNIPAVKGLPAGGAPPGYFPAGGITPEMFAAANPYQQQYIAAMMQQQRMMMNGQDRGFQTMAYARPPPAVAYMPPPQPEYTHFFSDENTNSCTVM